MAVAGPASNIAIAVIFSVLVRSADVLGLSDSFVQLSFMIILLNIFLACFNLVPFPPLDGSKILPKLLPFSLAMKYDDFRRKMEQNAGLSFMIIILIFVFVLSRPLYELTFWLTTSLIGI